MEGCSVGFVGDLRFYSQQPQKLFLFKARLSLLAEIRGTLKPQNLRNSMILASKPNVAKIKKKTKGKS
jgi:hypothetical protein